MTKPAIIAVTVVSSVALVVMLHWRRQTARVQQPVVRAWLPSDPRVADKMFSVN